MRKLKFINLAMYIKISFFATASTNFYHIQCYGQKSFNLVEILKKTRPAWAGFKTAEVGFVGFD